MRVPFLIAAPSLAALLSMLIGAGAAAATEEIAPGDRVPPAEPLPRIQADPTPQPDPEPAVGVPDGSSAAAGTEAARAAEAAHLDALFAELSDPENDNWEDAQSQIYAAWSRSGSASMDLLARRADTAMESQDFETALSFLDDLVRLAPGYAEGWNKRATIYFLRDEYGRSLRDIARVLALEPRHFGAYAGLGIILDRLGDKKGALEAYRRAISIHPNLPGAADGVRKLTREVEGERT